MIAILALLSMWTGATKAVSVCGVNGAFAAQPARANSKFAVLSYFVGLYLGAVLLVALVAALGTVAAAAAPVSAEIRTALAATVLVVLGTWQAIRGDTVLPHIAWAVPRHWMVSRFGLALFGAIRGVAIFNHSPFASMHAWLVVLFLMPSQLGVLAAAALLAVGLAAWSIAFAVSAILTPQRTSSLMDDFTLRMLSRRQLVARVDGLALVAFGLALPFSAQVHLFG